MKNFIIGASIAVTLATASNGFAQPTDSAGVGTTTGGGHVCLWTYNIDHTHYVDPRTVLFYMKDGHIWQNNLRSSCAALEFHGFSYVTRSDQICGPEIGIRVIKTGEVCSLGEFVPYKTNSAAAQ